MVYSGREHVRLYLGTKKNEISDSRRVFTNGRSLKMTDDAF